MEAQNTETWSEKAMQLAHHPLNLGEMTPYDGVALVHGPCGDRMAIWIRMENRRIADITFVTDGCGATLAAGSAVTELAKNCTPFKARSITPQAVIQFCDGLPPSHTHCAFLAVQTLTKALDAL